MPGVDTTATGSAIPNINPHHVVLVCTGIGHTI